MAKQFDGKILEDINISLPKLEDIYYNDIIPIVNSSGLTKTIAHFYVEEPIGGEDAIGFLYNKDDVFTIKCKPSAFDLSTRAMYTGATCADAFLFNPSDQSVEVGQNTKYCTKEMVEKNLKYFNELKTTEDFLANKENLKGIDYKDKLTYKEQLHLQLMCVSAPKTPKYTIESIPAGEKNVFTKDYGITEKSREATTARQYREFASFRPEFIKLEDGKEVYRGEFSPKTQAEINNKQYVMRYDAKEKISLYNERKQAWKIKEDTSIYYVIQEDYSTSEEKRNLAYQIRDDVYNLIKSASDIRICIPASVNSAKVEKYQQYWESYTTSDSTFWECVKGSLSDLYNDYYKGSDYCYSGYNLGGLDSRGRVISVIYLKTTKIDGAQRWINLNKYLLATYFDKVANMTDSSIPDAAGTDFYIANAPAAFNPSSYNIGIANFQDMLVSEELELLQQDNRRIELQEKVFKESGHHFCNEVDDFYDWTVSIGDVSFFVPPTQIKMINTTKTERIPILRAKGTMAKNTEKVENQLEISLYFNNDDGINGYPITTDLWTKRSNQGITADEKAGTDKLFVEKSSEAFKNDKTKQEQKDNGMRTYYMNGIRALISEFKFCPFLPIVNRYINETLGIGAVSLEQILIKTVPNFPRLLVANLVMKKFDYNVYMPELGDLHYKIDETDPDAKIINPFSRCINYDLLRYYYQKPILYGNEIQQKLDDGKVLIKDSKTDKLIETPYTFNSIEFIRDTVFKNRTTLMPCKFLDPTISIYVANEDYLKKLRRIKRSVMRKKLGYASVGDNYTPSDNYTARSEHKEIFDAVDEFYPAFRSIYSKYENRRRELDIIIKNKMDPKTGKGYPYLDDSITIDGQTYNNIIDAQYNYILVPMLKEFQDMKDVKDSQQKEYIYNVRVVRENVATENSYSFTQEDIKKGNVHSAPVIYMDVRMPQITKPEYLRDIAKEAYTGTSQDIYHDLSELKDSWPLKSRDSDTNPYSIKIRLADFSNMYTNTIKGLYLQEDSSKWYKTDYDKMFLDFCYMNGQILSDANQEILELKEAMDYENVKSVKFDEYLKDSIVMSFECSMSNNFAPMHVQASEGYAGQYLGSSDNYISWHIRTKDADLVKMLEDIPRKEAYYMRYYHSVLPCFPIRIDSEFTRLMGIFEVSIEEVSSATIPNYPGVYDVHIRAISVDRTLRNRESLRSVANTPKTEDIGLYETPKTENELEINNSGVKRGTMRSQIQLRTHDQLEHKLARTELYPDLELPKLQELVDLGFRFIRYKDKEFGREKEQLFVDPDFYMFYPHLLFSKLIKDQIANHFGSLDSGNELRDDEKIELQVSDRTGAKIGWDADGRPDLKTANDNFKTQLSQIIKDNEIENRAFEDQQNRIKLIKEVPALMIGEKRNWAISTRIIVALKESYIINLQNLLDKRNSQNAKNIIDKNLYDQLVETAENFNENFFDVKNENSAYGRARKVRQLLKEKAIIAGPGYKSSKKYDDQISEKVEYMISTNDSLFYSKELLKRLYIDVEDYSENKAKNNEKTFLTSCTRIMLSMKAVNTGKYEYSPEISEDDWKGDQYRDQGQETQTEFGMYSLKGNRDPYLGKKRSLNNENEYVKILKNDKVDIIDYSHVGPFNIRVFTQAEILPFLNEDEKKELDEYLLTNPKDKTKFVIDPYYRFKSDTELRTYLTTCRDNINFATEAQFRIIIWWLTRLIDCDIFPSYCFDIRRSDAKVAQAASENIKNLLKRANNNKAITIDDSQLNTLAEYAKTNESAIDAGKIFTAAMFCLLDMPLDARRNIIFEKMLQRDYEGLELFRNSSVSIMNPAKTQEGDRKEAVFRRFLMTLCGYKEIQGPEYVGRAGEATPIAQFISNYNTKLAIAACGDPNKYIYHSFYDMLRNDYRGRLLRAFPTFYCMFIDEGKEIGMWKLHDNFYSMNGINEITITKSRKMPADTCSMVLSNNYNTFTVDDEDGYVNYVGSFFGELFDSIFNQRKVAGEAERRRLAASWVNRAKLSPGIRIHVRIGYGSDARELAAAFNGVIAEVHPNAKAIQVVAQGNGIELLNPFTFDKNADEIAFTEQFGNDIIGKNGAGASPCTLLCNLLRARGANARYAQGKYNKSQWFFKSGEKHWDSDFTWGLNAFLEGLTKTNYFGITHFGDPDWDNVFPDGEICQNIYEVSRFPSMNNGGLDVFGPAKGSQIMNSLKNVGEITATDADTGQDISISSSGGITSYEDDVTNQTAGPRLSFRLRGKSFWDALHICQSVAPDYVCGIANFGFRDTIFFGAPHYYYAYQYVKYDKEVYVERRKPFEQIHLYYSESDIITNNIRASSDRIKTVAVGLYQKDGGLWNDGEEIGPLFVDKDIYPENQKSFIFDTNLLFRPRDKWWNSNNIVEKIKAGSNAGIDGLVNPINNTADRLLLMPGRIADQMTSFLEEEDDTVQEKYDSAKKIAWAATANALKNSMKEMYQGEIVVIGDPSVKPNDRMHIVDIYNDIDGEVLVRDVVHVLNLQTGFTTTMNADLITTVDDRDEFFKRTKFGCALDTAIAAARWLGLYFLGGYMENHVGNFLEVNKLKSWKDTLKEAGAMINKLNEIPEGKLSKVMQILEAEKETGQNVEEVLKKIFTEKERLDNHIETLEDAKKHIGGDFKKFKEVLEEYEKHCKDCKILPKINAKSNLTSVMDELRKVTTPENIEKVAAKAEKLQGHVTPRTLKIWTGEFWKSRGKLLGEYAENILIMEEKGLIPTVNKGLTSLAELKKIDGLISAGKTVGKLGVKGLWGSAKVYGRMFSSFLPGGFIATLAMDMVIAASSMMIGQLNKYLYFTISNQQVLKVFPLKKWGMAYTAGLEGSMGLVYGSPTWNKMGPIEKFIGEYLVPSSSESAFWSVLKSCLLDEQVINAAAKYRRPDNDFYLATSGNPIGDEMKLERTVYGVAQRNNGIKFKSIMGLSLHKRLKRSDFVVDNTLDAKVEKEMTKKEASDYQEYKRLLEKTKPKSKEDFLKDSTNNGLFHIEEVIKLKPYMKNMSGIDFFLTQHRIVNTNPKNKSLVDHTVIYKNSGTDTPKRIFALKDGDILDVPYLTSEAIDVLENILSHCKEEILEKQKKDQKQDYKDYSGTHIILLSALRIGDEDPAANSGNSFMLIGQGLLQGNKLQQIIENIENDIKIEVTKRTGLHQNCVFESVRKGSKIKININPLAIKEEDENKTKNKTPGGPQYP